MGYTIVNPSRIKPQGEVWYRTCNKWVRYEWVKLDPDVEWDNELIQQGFTHRFCHNFDAMYLKLDDGSVVYNPTCSVFAVKMLKTTIIFEDGQRAKNIKVSDYAFNG
jgi:hypothetical protein